MMTRVSVPGPAFPYAGVGAAVGEPIKSFKLIFAEAAVMDQANRQPDLEQWRRQYLAATRYWDLAPWDWMDDLDLFAVEYPRADEAGYCTVLGGAGVEFEVPADRKVDKTVLTMPHTPAYFLNRAASSKPPVTSPAL